MGLQGAGAGSLPQGGAAVGALQHLQNVVGKGARIGGVAVDQPLTLVRQHIGDAARVADHAGQPQQHRFAQTVGAVFAGGGQHKDIGVQIRLPHRVGVQGSQIADMLRHAKALRQLAAVRLVGEQPVGHGAQQRSLVQRRPARNVQPRAGVDLQHGGQGLDQGM